MSINGNRKKTDQLGQPHGTATAKLKKLILFDLLKRLNLSSCFQCGKPIDSITDLSIEHKEPWLDSEDPKAKFFDLDNIAFSHLSCNSSAGRTANKKYFTVVAREAANRQNDKNYKLRNYTSEKRHAQYIRTGK